MRGKRKKRQQPTAEEKSHSFDLKLRRVIAKSAVDLAVRDEEARRQMVAQTFGFKLPGQEERSRTELVTFLDELAIQELKREPALAQRIAHARIRKLTQDMGLKVEGEEWLEKPFTMDDFIEQFRKVNELKQVLGVKEPGLLESLLQPEVIINFLKMLQAMTGGVEQKPAAAREFIWVQENGEEIRITEEEYLKLINKGNIKSINKVAGDAENEEPVNPGETKDPLPESENSSAPEVEEEGSGASGSGD